MWAKPKAQFNISTLWSNIINPNIEFENLSEDGNSYSWEFGDGAVSEENNPSHKYKKTGLFDVQLITSSDFGCKDTSIQKIDIKEVCTFYAPTAFSPDNDYKNDNFYISGSGIAQENFLLIVYNRWGEAIWQTEEFNSNTQKSGKWNGIAKGNKRVSNGVYKWLVTYKDINGLAHEETGEITLLR